MLPPPPPPPKKMAATININANDLEIRELSAVDRKRLQALGEKWMTEYEQRVMEKFFGKLNLPQEFHQECRCKCINHGKQA